MKIAFIGVSHWHLPLYLDPTLDEADAQVVGVSDPDPARAAEVGERLGCRWSPSWEELLAETEPEFVFVLGRHIDMPPVVRHLIEAGTPFAVEKPAGVASAQVAELAQLAEERNAFAAVPFVFRQSRLVELLAELPDDDPLYLSVKFVAGSVDRYRGGSDWMLDRSLSGGGCMVNLGIHFFDLARMLLGTELEVAGAMMSNALFGLGIEDHGVAALRAGSGGALIESGYLYPSAHLTFDLHFSVRTPRRHLAARDDTGIEVLEPGKEPRFVEAPVSNVRYYPVFVRDVLRRVREGEPPVADLADLAPAFRLLEDAYRLSPLPAAAVASH